MISFYNGVFDYSTNRNLNNLGIKEYANLSSEAMQLLKSEYWLQLNNPNTINEVNKINEQYNENCKVKSLGKRK